MKRQKQPFVYTVSINERPVYLNSNKEFKELIHDRAIGCYFITFSGLKDGYDILIGDMYGCILLRGPRGRGILGNDKLDIINGSVAKGILTEANNLEYKLRCVDKQNIEMVFGK